MNSILRYKNEGYTLLELLLGISILVIIMAAAAALPFGQKLSIELEEEANKIVGVLRTAQQNSITGENAQSWGVYFNNTGAPLYEMFVGTDYASGVITETFFLSEGTQFNNPILGSSLEILFAKRSGENANGVTDTISLSTTSGNHTQTVSVSPVGRIMKE